jgi:hypothetical protein
LRGRSQRRAALSPLQRKPVPNVYVFCHYQSLIELPSDAQSSRRVPTGKAFVRAIAVVEQVAETLNSCYRTIIMNYH